MHASRVVLSISKEGRALIFSGKIDGLRGSRQQIISRLVHRFEGEGIQVVKTDDGVRARVPGMDTAWFPIELPLEHLDDHLHVDVRSDGQVQYRWVYWTRFQAALHGIITVIFAMDLWMRQTGPAELMPAFLAAQTVPLIVFFLSTQIRARALFSEA